MTEADDRALRPCLDQFMEASVFESGLADKTLTAYASDIDLYLADLEEKGIKSMSEVLQEDILDHLVGLRNRELSARSAARHLSAIRRFQKPSSA